MPDRGKKYQDAAKLVERERVYEPVEAMDAAQADQLRRFRRSAEAHIRLGVDPRHADQMVRGTVVLPHGTGKNVRVIVFAQGEKAQEALRAGADEVGGEDLAKRIEAGWLEFDLAVATPDMMGVVGRLGRILGRRGLMPNPKSGTITFDLERAIKRGQGRPGRVQGRQGRYHPLAFGKASFEPQQLAENLAALMDAINRARPSAAKGQYFKSLTVARRWARASGSTSRPSRRAAA